MKMFQLLAILITGTTFPLFGASPTWTISTGIVNQYLARPGIVLHDSPIWVNSVTMNLENAYAGVWSSTAIDNAYNKSLGDEIDFYAGWQKKFDWVSVDLRASYFALYDLGRMNNDLWVLDSQFDFTKVPVVQPYVALRYYGEVGDESPSDGGFYWIGLKRSQPLGISLHKEELKLQINTSFAASSGALSRESGTVFLRIGATLPIPLAKDLSLVPSLTFQKSLDEGMRSYTRGKDEIAFGLSLNYRFK